MHVTLFILDDGIFMSGSIVDKVGDLFHFFVSSLCLFGGDGAEGGKYSAVNGMGIIKEFYNKGLDFVDTCSVERV